jgi:protein-S-isoprenylcysteine O-methyltransferase Ste14
LDALEQFSSQRNRGIAKVEYILLGCLALVIAFFFDPAALKGIRYLKQVVGLACVLMFGFALVMVCLQTDRLSLPGWVSCIGWPLLALSIFLLVYSLFLELPFRETYAENGVGERLIKTGTWALVRHPGVLWFALLLVALLMISGTKLFLIAAPIWFLLDVLHVWYQERFYFSKMFPGYEQYKRETPMLIPNRRSVIRCIKTMHKD